MTPQADPLVGMREEVKEFAWFKGSNAFGKDFLYFFDRRGLELFSVSEGVNIALAGFGPAAAVVGNVELAIVTPVEVGECDSFEEVGLLAKFKICSFGVEGKAFDEAAVGAGHVAGKEEVAVEFFGKSDDAGIVGKPARSVRTIGDGWVDVCGLAVVPGVPETFVHPRVNVIFFAGRFSADMVVNGATKGGHGLVPHFPTGVAVLDEVNNTLAVPLVVVVVDREEIAEFIKDDLLGVAEVDVKFLELRAVGVGPENAAGIGAREGFAVLLDMISAVADGPVDLAVGSPGEAIEIVAGEADAHPEAVDQGFDLLGFPVVVGVLEAVNPGNHREVNSAVFFDEATGRARERIVEVAAKNGGFVRDSVAIGVLKHFDDFGILREFLPSQEVLSLAGPFLVEGGAVFESHGGNVSVYAVAQEFPPVADVLNLDAPAIGFSNVDAVLGVEADRGGVLDLVLVGEALECQPLGNGDFLVELGRDELGTKGKDGGE